MSATFDQPERIARPIDWDSTFLAVNSWRGACMHHFSTVEAAVTETLLALSAAKPAESSVRLRHLIGQKFEDLALAISPGGSFEKAGKQVLVELSQYRERHEAFRTLLCHGTIKVTVEHSGRWVLFIRTLSIRSREPDRAVFVLEQSEAESKLAALKNDGKKLASILGQLRKMVSAA